MASENIANIRDGSWPSDELESVATCPVCSKNRRTLLHDDLWDATFFAAPGRWSLWRCTTCRSAYLDPRPTSASIGRAYHAYYTHRDEFVANSGDSGRSRFRRALSNGYRNWRYGTTRRPSSKMGAILGILLPPLRRDMDSSLRYLPRITPTKPKVLDLGCGGGDWLGIATAAGWDAHGADPDAEAVMLARKRGFNVREGSIEAWSDAEGQFDAVTLNHVIEHVHDPRQVMSAAFKLLRPGGQLYIVTPNIDALSYLVYGRSWRGLEPPRHLVLFNRASLLALAKEVGFVRVRERRPASPVSTMISESKRIQRFSDEQQNGAASSAREEKRLRWKAMIARSRVEFLTITCERPR